MRQSVKRASVKTCKLSIQTQQRTSSVRLIEFASAQLVFEIRLDFLPGFARNNVRPAVFCKQPHQRNNKSLLPICLALNPLTYFSCTSVMIILQAQEYCQRTTMLTLAFLSLVISQFQSYFTVMLTACCSPRQLQ